MYCGKTTFQTFGRFTSHSADDTHITMAVFLHIRSSDIPEKEPAAFREPDSAHGAVAVHPWHMDKHVNRVT